MKNWLKNKTIHDWFIYSVAFCGIIIFIAFAIFVVFIMGYGIAQLIINF